MAAYDRVLASLKVVASSIDAQTGKKTKKRQRSAEDREEEVDFLLCMAIVFALCAASLQSSSQSPYRPSILR